MTPAIASIWTANATAAPFTSSDRFRAVATIAETIVGFGWISPTGLSTPTSCGTIGPAACPWKMRGALKRDSGFGRDDRRAPAPRPARDPGGAGADQLRHARRSVPVAIGHPSRHRSLSVRRAGEFGVAQQRGVARTAR